MDEIVKAIRKYAQAKIGQIHREAGRERIKEHFSSGKMIDEMSGFTAKWSPAKHRLMRRLAGIGLPNLYTQPGVLEHPPPRPPTKRETKAEKIVVKKLS